MHNRALLSSMIDQQVIELRARDLPRDGTLVMHRFKEIERPRLLARGIRKLHAVLANKRTCLQFLEHAQTTEGPVSVSHQRFADVMTRKNFFLETGLPGALRAPECRQQNSLRVHHPLR